jgi:hypothetical protein
VRSALRKSMNYPKFYPAWRYHPTEPSRVVANAEEDADLGEGWFDHPLKASEARLQLDTAASAGESPAPTDAPKRSHHRRPPPSP